MGVKVRVRLMGGAARLGEVPASDVAELLVGLERAMARAAGHVRGKRAKQTGRWPNVVADSVHLKLVAIKSGSIEAVLELPSAALPPGGLGLGNVESLGEAALARTMKTLKGRAGDPDVAATLDAWAGGLGIGTRYDAVEVRWRRANKTETVRIDEKKRRRFAVIAGGTASRPGSVVGQLVEADFESRTAHLRVPTGRVTMDFAPEQADAVYNALRHQASVVGDTEEDEHTREVKSIKVRDIVAAEQLATGIVPGRYWEARSIGERAREQGIVAPQRLDDLIVQSATAREIDGAMAALEKM